MIGLQSTRSGLYRVGQHEMWYKQGEVWYKQGEVSISLSGCSFLEKRRYRR